MVSLSPKAQEVFDRMTEYRTHYLTMPASAHTMTMNAFDVPHLIHLHKFTDVKVIHSDFTTYAFICVDATMPRSTHKFRMKVRSYVPNELIVDVFTTSGDHMYTTIEINEDLEENKCKHTEIFLYNKESTRFTRPFMESVFKSKQPITHEDEVILDQVTTHLPEEGIDPIMDEYIKWYQRTI